MISNELIGTVIYWSTILFSISLVFNLVCYLVVKRDLKNNSHRYTEDKIFHGEYVLSRFVIYIKGSGLLLFLFAVVGRLILVWRGA